MKSKDDLRGAFAVYWREIAACEQANCYWALLHMLLALPDVCAALEGSTAAVRTRYVAWCSAYFPSDPRLTPEERYMIRNAVLHEGSSLPRGTRYKSVSFVDPRTGLTLHQNVNPDGAGVNLTLDVKALADDTRGAMEHWFEALQTNSVKNAAVESNLPKLVREQAKDSRVQVPGPGGAPTFQITQHITTSSTG